MHIAVRCSVARGHRDDEEDQPPTRTARNRVLSPSFATLFRLNITHMTPFGLSLSMSASFTCSTSGAASAPTAKWIETMSLIASSSVQAFASDHQWGAGRAAVERAMHGLAPAEQDRVAPQRPAPPQLCRLRGVTIEEKGSDGSVTSESVRASFSLRHSEFGSQPSRIRRRRRQRSFSCD